jgi:hypothetical protein
MATGMGVVTEWCGRAFRKHLQARAVQRRGAVPRRGAAAQPVVLCRGAAPRRSPWCGAAALCHGLVPRHRAAARFYRVLPTGPPRFAIPRRPWVCLRVLSVIDKGYLRVASGVLILDRCASEVYTVLLNSTSGRSGGPRPAGGRRYTVNHKVWSTWGPKAHGFRAS